MITGGPDTLTLPLAGGRPVITPPQDSATPEPSGVVGPPTAGPRFRGGGFDDRTRSHCNRSRSTHRARAVDQRGVELRRGLGVTHRRDAAEHRGDRPRRAARPAERGGALAADRLR